MDLVEYVLQVFDSDVAPTITPVQQGPLAGKVRVGVYRLIVKRSAETLVANLTAPLTAEGVYELTLSALRSAGLIE